jgi:hypothetical protein
MRFFHLYLGMKTRAGLAVMGWNYPQGCDMGTDK